MQRKKILIFLSEKREKWRFIKKNETRDDDKRTEDYVN